jgi:hypothetical protein
MFFNGGVSTTFLLRKQKVAYIFEGEFFIALT